MAVAERRTADSKPHPVGQTPGGLWACQAFLTAHLVVFWATAADRWAVLDVGSAGTPSTGFLAALAAFTLGPIAAALAGGRLPIPPRTGWLVIKFGELALAAAALALLAMNEPRGWWLGLGLWGALFAAATSVKHRALASLVPAERMTRAMGGQTLATALGGAAGIGLACVLPRSPEATPAAIGGPGLAMVGLALAGAWAALMVPRCDPVPPPAGDERSTLPRALTWLGAARAARTVRWGNAAFHLLTAIAAVALVATDREWAALAPRAWPALAAGLLLCWGAGGWVAGLLSPGRVELGLVPWGALGAACCALLLGLLAWDQWSGGVTTLGNWTLPLVALGGLGVAAGWYSTPLVAYLLTHEPIESTARRMTSLAGWGWVACWLAVGAAVWLRGGERLGNPGRLPAALQASQLNAAELERLDEAERLVSGGESASGEGVSIARIDRAAGHLIEPWIPAEELRAMSQIDARYRAPNEQPSSGGNLPSRGADEPADSANRALEAGAGAAGIGAWKGAGLSRQALLYAFESCWRASTAAGGRSEPPSLHLWLLERAPESIRSAGLAGLLWRVMEVDRAAGAGRRLADYQAMFPPGSASRLVAKQVERQFAIQPRVTARQLWLLAAAGMLAVGIYAAGRLPQAMARLPLWWAFRGLYRIRVNGFDRVPPAGGAVLVMNHLTWIDGLTVLLMTSRRLRMIAWAANFNNPIMRVLARFGGVILITGGPKSIQRGLTEARKALQRGELIGIFPEGGLSRTGQVQTFRPGLMKILEPMPVPVIPVYIDQIWGSIFSYAYGKTIWRFPSSFRHPITVNLGEPMFRPESIHQIRQAVLVTGADSVAQRQPPFVSPAAMFVRQAKRRKFASKILDSTGQELSGGMLLARSLILRDLLRRNVLAADEKYVGILLPPSCAAVACNAALALDRRVAVNLNYTLSPKLIDECVRQAGVRHVLTSRRVMEKFSFTLEAPLYYLEDLQDKLTSSMKARAMVAAFAQPARWLEGSLGLSQLRPDDLLTIIFTSGSTGVPKGVMLSQQNIASNVAAIGQVINLNPQDTILGALPFFHSFGYTVTLWGVLGLNVRGAYHFNPLEANQVGRLAEKARGTVLLGTPTFLRGYLRKCKPEEFASVNTVVAGAEKLPTELAAAFESRFGVRPIEGYGTTETSPLVSVNVPPSRSIKNFQVDCKEGTVGRTIPNVAARITDLEDETRILGANQSGMLWIRGPNIMLGYLNRPDATREVIVDGWYKTGDVAEIDDNGFIRLTGRMSRFSKLGGEMVPHIQVEDALNAALLERDYEEMKLAVTAVGDPRKGERLVVLHTQLDRSPAELRQALRDHGLPNLYIPSENSFYQVDKIPVLGSGKLDLKQLKELAERLAASR